MKAERKEMKGVWLWVRESQEEDRYRKLPRFSEPRWQRVVEADIPRRFREFREFPSGLVGREPLLKAPPPSAF
jgi:hypothetical protein